MKNAIDILEALFISKVRIKVLKFLLLEQNNKLHLRGIVRVVQEEINAVRRELNRLVEVGIVSSEQRGAKKIFVINKANAYYPALLDIFHKSFGLGGQILENKNNLGEVKFAILTNDFLNGNNENNQRIDLVVVGNIALPELTKIIEEQEKALGKEINYAVVSEREFMLKKKRRDPFVFNMILQQHILLIGEHGELIE